ncbi:hypothetical protein HOH87_04710 [bacterium]|jgi:hypothetical protein|nr:hypothetical protein [bacterium]
MMPLIRHPKPQNIVRSATIRSLSQPMGAHSEPPTEGRSSLFRVDANRQHPTYVLGSTFNGENQLTGFRSKHGSFVHISTQNITPELLSTIGLMGVERVINLLPHKSTSTHSVDQINASGIDVSPLFESALKRDPEKPPLTVIHVENSASDQETKAFDRHWTDLYNQRSVTQTGHSRLSLIVTVPEIFDPRICPTTVSGQLVSSIFGGNSETPEKLNCDAPQSLISLFSAKSLISMLALLDSDSLTQLPADFTLPSTDVSTRQIASLAEGYMASRSEYFSPSHTESEPVPLFSSDPIFGDPYFQSQLTDTTLESLIQSFLKAALFTGKVSLSDMHTGFYRLPPSHLGGDSDSLS